MLKNLNNLILNSSKEVSIRPFSHEDINIVSRAFTSIGWNKPVTLFEGYLNEIQAGKRLAWIAVAHEQFAGYITLKWHSDYPFFKERNIPEIMDLNVLPSIRRKGIGACLMDMAEKEAATRSDTIGIGVGLYAGEDGGYGSAQRLYMKRGYIADGKGVTYNYEPTIPGNSYPLDDSLILWLTKRLR